MNVTRFLPTSMRSKLLLSFSVLIACIAVFIFAFFPDRLQRSAMRTATSQADAIRNMTAYSLRSALVFSDTAVIGDILTGASEAGDIAFLQVRDETGRVISGRGDHAAYRLAGEMSGGGRVSSDGSTYLTTSDVVYGGRKLGSVTVGMSLSELRDEVAAARTLGTLVGLFILGIGILVVIGVSTSVTRPIRAVAQTMNRIAEGDMGLRAAEDTDREVAELARAFNTLVNGLACAREELARNNARLEERVDERTRELRISIEDQRRVQSALATSEAQARATSEMLQSLIDLAPQAIVSVDMRWNVTRWNRAAEALFGWKASEVIGRPLAIVPEEERSSMAEMRHRIEGGQSLLPTEAVRMRKDGSLVSVLVAASALRNRDGVRSGYIAVLTDLTDRKQLEEQLRQSQKMEAIGRLAGGVAHDFNNLLTVITSYAAMLLEGRQNQQERDDIDQISAAAARASALTRQLLTFSRKEIVQMRPLRINEIAHEMGPMLRRLLRENIQLATSFSGRNPLVVADPTQLEQVIMNLTVNASDAMPNGGVIAIDTNIEHLDESYVREHAGARTGPHVVLRVSDTGIGMDKATLSRIFEPFFTTKEVGRGTGLGLATTYAVVTKLGGHIDVTSAPGAGSIFRIYLPMAPAEQNADATNSGEDTTHSQKHCQSRVLLVEDESVLRKVLKRGLERNGFVVYEAADAETAVTVMAQQDGGIDVLVTDLMMPGINGRDLAEILTDAVPNLRVVFMSGYADDTIDREGLVGENRTFLQKPFTGSQLAEVIRNNSGLQLAGAL